MKTRQRIGSVFAATLLFALALLGSSSSQSAALSYAPVGEQRVFLPFMSGSTAPEIPASCFKWANQLPLQDAVNQHDCVVLRPGTWTTNVQIAMPAGHSLLGYGREQSILRANAPWVGNGVDPRVEAVVHNNGQPDVTVKYLTIDANKLATFGIGAHGPNMMVDSVAVKNATCNGVAIAAAGWTVQNSLIAANGSGCWTGVPGSGIYAKRQNDNGVYSPRILNNLLERNVGPAIDVDQVLGGTVAGNTISENQAWAAISINASNWTITGNNITHPQNAAPLHPGHTECWPTHASILPAGIAICRQPESNSGGPVQYTRISRNRISAGHGIRLIGDDESNPAWVPQFSTVEDNDLSGSIVGCIDDFEPRQSQPGMNTWTGNNCNGTNNGPPVYLWRLCPNSVSSATVRSWEIGVAEPPAVQARINEFDANRRDGGEFRPGDLLPAGALVATSFDPAGNGSRSWEDYPVRTVVRSGSWGLFEVVSAFTAPTPGACLLVFP